MLMGWFAVRVELHQLNNQRQPTWDDYARLHVAMQQRGYFRVIKGGDGNWYHLPHANYSAWFDNKNGESVRDEVTAIVATVWSNSGNLVTAGQSWWQGLIPASAQDVQRLAS
jgi:hypothetical protein